MLGNDGVVIITRDNLQFALQVLGLADEAGLLIPLGIILWCTHITFAIHDLVPFPVNDRTTSHTYLEDIGIVGHQ